MVLENDSFRTSRCYSSSLLRPAIPLSGQRAACACASGERERASCHRNRSPGAGGASGRKTAAPGAGRPLCSTREKCIIAPPTPTPRARRSLVLRPAPHPARASTAWHGVRSLARPRPAGGGALGGGGWPASAARPPLGPRWAQMVCPQFRGGELLPERSSSKHGNPNPGIVSSVRFLEGENGPGANSMVVGAVYSA